MNSVVTAEHPPAHEPTRRARGRPPNPQMRTEKHARMLKAALDLFVHHGYDNVTVEQIARNAGQSKGAFYWYFKDKEDCLRQILEHEGAKLDLALTRTSVKGAKASARLLELSDFRIWGKRDFVRFVFLLNGLAHSRSDSVREMFKRLSGRWSSMGFELVRKLCRESAREAGWSEARYAAFDFDTWVYCYLACYQGMYEQLLRGFLPAPSAERVAGSIHAAFIHPLLEARAGDQARSV